MFSIFPTSIRTERKLFGQFKPRLTLHDRTIIGKCMKRLNKQRLASRFEVNVADRSHGNSTACIESVEHAFAFVIRNQLLLKRPEDFWIRRLQLEIAVVPRSTSTADRICLLTM